MNEDDVDDRISYLLTQGDLDDSGPAPVHN